MVGSESNCRRCNAPIENQASTRRWRPTGKTWRGLIVATALCLIAGWTAGQILFPSNERVLRIGDPTFVWPFSSSKVTLRCRVETYGGTERPVATVVDGYSEYGLNGAAIGIAGFPNFMDRFDMRFRRDGPVEERARDSVRRALAMALELCPSYR